MKEPILIRRVCRESPDKTFCQVRLKWLMSATSVRVAENMEVADTATVPPARSPAAAAATASWKMWPLPRYLGPDRAANGERQDLPNNRHRHRVNRPVS